MNSQSKVLLYTLQTLSKFHLKFLQTLGAFIACFSYYFLQAKTVQNAKLNLKLAFPELSQQQFNDINKQATINEVKSYFEFISIWGSSTEKNLSRIHQIHGEALFHAALQQQKGMVLIVPHFGTWEILNSWLGQFTKLTIMYKPSKNQVADAFVKAARCREHANLVPTNESGVKEIFRALKQGGTTIILPDHSPDRGNDFTPWFGVPLKSSQLTAKLIQKTKASTLMLYAIRNKNAGFDLHIEEIDPYIYDAPSGTLVIHQILEALIKKHPEHYHWSYKRFQASPETSGLYDKPADVAIGIVRDIQQQSHLS